MIPTLVFSLALLVVFVRSFSDGPKRHINWTTVCLVDAAEDAMGEGQHCRACAFAEVLGKPGCLASEGTQGMENSDLLRKWEGSEEAA